MKRIITCSDGTWNTIKPDKVTNVVKVFNSICKDGVDHEHKPVRQVKAYDEGVGTGYTLKDRVFGGATGSGIDTNIKDMYCFIILNYEPGDQLYLFGFSRGAYTARSLAGLIRNSGVLKPQNLHLVQKAYDLYRDKNEYSSPESDLMISFRNQYAYEPETPVFFIGVWDTVGSLGIPLPWYKLLNMKKYKFHDVKLSSNVRYAYQALAINEKRKLFRPTLWSRSRKAIAKQHPGSGYEQTLEQRWFAGVHSNIGGGYHDCGLSNLALAWMIDRAAAAGLCFNAPPLIEENGCDKGKIINSYTLPYWFWLPKARKILVNRYANEVIDKSVETSLKNNSKKIPQIPPGVYQLFSEQDQQLVKPYGIWNYIQGVPTIFIYFVVLYAVYGLIFLLYH